MDTEVYYVLCGLFADTKWEKNQSALKTAALTSKPKNYSLAYYKDIFDKGDSISSSS